MKGKKINKKTDTPSKKTQNKAKRGKGRPTLMTDEVVNKIIKAISIGASHELSAGYAGISYATFQNWLRLGRDVRVKSEAGEEIDDQEAHYLDFLRLLDGANSKAGFDWQTVVDLHAKKDPEYALRMLKLRFSGYNDRSPIQYNVSVDLSKYNLTEEQLQKIVKGEITDEQIQRIANGENPADVITTSSAGTLGASPKTATTNNK